MSKWINSTEQQHNSSSGDGKDWFYLCFSTTYKQKKLNKKKIVKVGFGISDIFH